MGDILQLDKTLHLGMIDDDCYDAFQQNRTDYFKSYHERFWGMRGYEKRQLQFRGEAVDEWVEGPKRKTDSSMISGDNVKALQSFLHDHGFLPGYGPHDLERGVFGYRTLSAVRIFQEYIRTVESKSEVGIPDGRVGKGTHDHMIRWKENKLYSIWGPEKGGNTENEYHWPRTSREYDLWLDLLRDTKQKYLNALKNTNDPSDNLDLFQLQEIMNFPKKSNSLKINNWSYNEKVGNKTKEDIHLIGLRCFHENRVKTGNDDLFVLLMNGMAFKFWGSTDPKPEKTADGLEPYLVEGQHKYRLSWHSRGGAGSKVYKALVPYDKGVLVFRDWSKTNALDENDIREGLQHNPTGKAGRNNPNPSINIHWTGDGHSNWSEGCQVISGRSYISPIPANGQPSAKIVDCFDFSAAGTNYVSAVAKKGVKKSRGAYTFVSDFVLVYSKPGQDYILYTLGRDGALKDFANQELLHLLNEQIPNSKLGGEHISGEALAQEMVSAMSERRKRSGTLA